MLTIDLATKQGRSTCALDTFLYNNNRYIFLGDEINDKVAAEICMALMSLEKLDSSKTITLFINSPGGSVTAGLAIYDCMQRLKAKVDTVCQGNAASMAAIILAGATGTRYITPNSRVLIHEPYTMGAKQAHAIDIQIAAKNMQRCKDILNGILAKHTGKSVADIENDCNREKDYIMYADEAVAYGLVDQILE